VPDRSLYLEFGTFIAPVIHPRQNPTRSLHRVLERIEMLDRLGFDEVWVGEHHSSGYEIIGSNEVFIATAAERTKRIRFGTGVVSLPYHNPFMVAERAVLLDHLTMGRVTLGVGPGSLPHDAAMLGIHMKDTRRMMGEALEALHLLLTTDEPLTMKTDWFTLHEAELQLKPYSHPSMEMAMTAMESPFGPSLAGRYGAGLVSLGANTPAGFAGLATHWGVLEEQAELHGQSVDRRKWRVVGTIHVAETREQARRDVQFGLPHFLEYITVSGRDSAWMASPDKPPETLDDVIDFMNGHNYACIGTPDDAIEFIRVLLETTGGFGNLLLFAHELADPEATNRSHDLIAREVMPVFQNSMAPLIKSAAVSKAKQAQAHADQRASILAAQEQYLKENVTTKFSSAVDSPPT
jgi:limonene 1,2-monooxygenase